MISLQESIKSFEKKNYNLSITNYLSVKKIEVLSCLLKTKLFKSKEFAL